MSVNGTTTQEEIDEFLDSVADDRGISRDDAEYVMDRTMMFMLGKKLDSVGSSDT